MSNRRPRVTVQPGETSRWLEGRGGGDWLEDAVEAGGGSLAPPSEAEALVWTEIDEPESLRAFLADHPGVRWVQLPFAGVEPYRSVLDAEHLWTCGKGTYGDSVAEHTLALILAGFRDLGHHLRARSWQPRPGRNLYGSRVTVLGGGGIARALLRLLAPFETEVTVVRRTAAPLAGATRVVGAEGLDAALAGTDVVVVALALTPETEGIIDARALGRLGPDTWLVNVARGRHVVTDDLVAALRDGQIAGAALDVTDPEPLPDDHPLWAAPNCLLTPHVANTYEMLQPRFARQVRENVHRYAGGRPLLGVVDPVAGY